MKFVLDAVSKSSGRLGRITRQDDLKNITLHTPVLLITTKGASVPYLSKEVFKMVTDEPQAFLISLTNTIFMEDALHEYKKGIGSFAALGHNLTFLTLKDPTEAAPSGYHEKNKLPIFTRYGKVLLDSEKFMALAEAFRPDCFHLLCDGDTNIETRKRVHKAVERSERFFNECLEMQQKSERLKQTFMIGAVEGGYNKEARCGMIGKIKDKAQGFFLDGFHLNGMEADHLDAGPLLEVVNHCCKLLPEEKMRIMMGAYNPVTLLKLIQAGVDVFDSSYAYLATERKQALVFNFDSSKKAKQFSIDLTNNGFKEDFDPFLVDCKCLACSKHTRAYAYHLIQCKELLGPILLMIHNLHHYLEFFKQIRKSIQEDTLPQLITLLETQYEAHKQFCGSSKQNGHAEQVNGIVIA